MTTQAKIDCVRRMVPRISERGQAYLLGIARAMRLIENPAVFPVPAAARPAGADREGAAAGAGP